MKAKCSEPNCRARGEASKAWCFHATCARQAGFEVQHDDELEEMPFYGKFDSLTAETKNKTS